MLPLHNQKTHDSSQVFSEQLYPSSSGKADAPISDSLSPFGSAPRSVGPWSKSLRVTTARPVLEEAEFVSSRVLDPCASQRHLSHPVSNHGSASMGERENLTRQKNGGGRPSICYHFGNSNRSATIDHSSDNYESPIKRQRTFPSMGSSSVDGGCGRCSKGNSVHCPALSHDGSGLAPSCWTSVKIAS